MMGVGFFSLEEEKINCYLLQKEPKFIEGTETKSQGLPLI